MLGKFGYEDFDYGYGVYIEYGTCSIVINGNAIIFGGDSQPRQIAVIHRNGRKRIGNLPFHFSNGICHFNNGTIFLCFDHEARRICRARYIYCFRFKYSFIIILLSKSQNR